MVSQDFRISRSEMRAASPSMEDAVIEDLRAVYEQKRQNQHDDNAFVASGKGGESAGGFFDFFPECRTLFTHDRIPFCYCYDLLLRGCPRAECISGGFSSPDRSLERYFPMIPVQNSCTPPTSRTMQVSEGQPPTDRRTEAS